jgi:hypothetical protein
MERSATWTVFDISTTISASIITVYVKCLNTLVRDMHVAFQIPYSALQRQDSNFQATTFRQKVIFSHKSQTRLDTLTYWLTDRQL